MHAEELVINGVSIGLGKRTIVDLPMPKLYDWTPLNMPVHVIRGKTPGPVLCVMAAIHGDEINGVEIIRRLLKRPALKKINGTIIAIPIANVYGFLYQERYLMDRRDLNRVFPGSKRGSLASRLANLITEELLSKATHIIDLHSGSLHRENLPQIRTNLDMPGIREFAEAFNAPVVLHSELRDGSMRQYTCEQGIPTLLYEAGESLRFDEFSIRTGINGILSSMQYLNMLTLKKHAVKKLAPSYARSSYWLRAGHSGILRLYTKLGSRVKKNQVLAIIANPHSLEEHKVIAPTSGIIIGKNNLPLVYEGAALFHIACFEELKQVAQQIEALQEEFEDIGEYVHPESHHKTE